MHGGKLTNLLKLSRTCIAICHATFSPTDPRRNGQTAASSVSLIFFFFSALGLILEEEKEPNYLNAGVGEYAVFNCDLDFPHETPIPYILQWNRDVSATTLTSRLISM